MDIRTFRAATLQEALEQVRETLGPDAAVLHTRQVKRGRLGIFASNLIEVEASVEMPVASRLSKRAKVTDTEASSGAVEPVLREAVAIETAIPATIASVDAHSASPSLLDDTHLAAPVPPTTLDREAFDDSSKPIRSTISTVERFTESARLTRPARESTENSAPRLPPAMFETLSEMLDAGIDPSEAKSLLQAAAQNLAPEQLNDPWLIQGRICQLVGKNLRVAEPIAVHQGHQAVVALVGPTGGGKTTTLAKLATSFQLDQSCQVGLITMDTFRPGAVDQLLQYAESLDAALEVVSSANQFMPALNRLKDCDAVFIDTAGRSPSDHEQISVLSGLLEAAQPTSVQLVLSATSSNGHIQAALKQFAPLELTGLVITKLDEAVGFGSWLSILQRCELPVSYLTHGQHVPHDITSANRRRLASLLLGHANQ